MTLKEIKESINSKSYNNKTPLIFYCKDGNHFLALQYVNAIANILNLQIENIEDFNSLLNVTDDIFGLNDSIIDDSLKLFIIPKFECNDRRFNDITNTVVVCDKIDDTTKVLFSNYLIEVPKLVDWQIKDYIYSKLKGVSTNKLDWLQNVCSNDIYRINNEIDKISIFSENARESIFDLMVEEDLYSDLTNFDIFKLSSAINSKDYNTITQIYAQKDILDIRDLALVVLMCQNFRNIILVKLNDNPTPENTGLSDKQIYAIKKSKCSYTKEQIIEIFNRLSKIDAMLKSGELSEQHLLDYVLINTLGV